MSHSANNKSQSNGKHPVNQNTTIIGKRYQMIREIVVPSRDCDLGKGLKMRENVSQSYKTYLAKDTGIIGTPLCVVKEIPLSIGNNVSSPQIDWDRLVTLQQKLGEYPEIPRILAYFTEKNYLYIIREYFEGKTLAQLSDRYMSQTEVLQIFVDILDVLGFVHGHNLIQGNVRPENIIKLDSSGKYTLVDFDNLHEAKLKEANLVDNRIPTLISNPNSYFAPEQSAGQPIISSDFYSLGKTLIYCLTKSLSNNWQHESQNQEIIQQLDPKLKQILEKTITPNVNARYHRVSEILKDLSRVEDVSTLMSANGKNLNNELQSTNIKVDSERHRSIATDEGQINSKKIRILPIALGLLGLLVAIVIADYFNPTIRPFYYSQQGKKALPTEPQVALDKFQKAIDENSKYTTAWIGRGDALFHLERYRSALLAYDKATELQPNSYLAWKGRGDALFRLERFEAALTAYNKSLQIKPDNPDSLNRKGRTLYKLERLDAALEAQEKALEIKPNHARSLSDRGIVLIGLGQYEEALKSFEDAQAIEPLNPEFWQNKALAWQYLGRNQEAFRLYQEALESYNNELQKQPRNVTALIDKGNVLTKLQQHAEAIDAYDRAIEINPNSHLAWLNKGNAYFALGKYDEALKSFDRALKIAPESYLTWHNRGSLLRDGKQDYQEAIASYEKATQLNPSFYHAWRDMGLALSQSGQQYLALKSFQTALQIKPEDYQSWVGRGIAFSSLGKIEEAVAAFDRAGEIQPNDPFVWMNKGYALEDAKQYAEACKAYSKVAQINPTLSPAIKAINKLGCQR